MAVAWRTALFFWLSSHALAQAGWQTATVQIDSIAVCAGEPVSYQVVLANTSAQPLAADLPQIAGQHVAWVLKSKTGEDSYDLAAMPDRITFVAPPDILARATVGRSAAEWTATCSRYPVRQP